MTRLNAQLETEQGQSLPGLEAGPMPGRQADVADKRRHRRVVRHAVTLGLAVVLALAVVLGVQAYRNAATPVALAADISAPATGKIPLADAPPAPATPDVAEASETVGATTNAETAPAEVAAEQTAVAEVADTPADTAAPAESAEAAESAEPEESAKAVAPANSPANAAGEAAAKPTKAKTPSIKLFGTVEFRGTLKGVPSWTSVIERNKQKPLLVAGAKLNASTGWDDFKKKLEAMPPMERLKAVNRFWNQWPYRLDPEVYKKPDYWAIPDEFRRNSGDCEDYSIAKYYTLKEVGISPDDMRIVVLMETIRNIAHAVLVVYLDGDAWILDNLSNSVLSHSRYKNYVPQFSVNEKFRWAHVRPK